MKIKECVECSEYKYIVENGKCKSCFDDNNDENETDTEYPDRMVYGTKYQMIKDIADKNGWDVDDMDIETVKLGSDEDKEKDEEEDKEED